MGHRNELHFHHFSRHNPIYGLDSLFITNYLLENVLKQGLPGNFSDDWLPIETRHEDFLRTIKEDTYLRKFGPAKVVAQTKTELARKRNFSKMAITRLVRAVKK